MDAIEQARKVVEEFEQKLIRNGLRFAAGRPGSPSSGIWSSFWNGSNYYVGARSILGSTKISLHASGVCRLALTPQHITFLQQQGIAPPADRAFVKWRRHPAPESGAHLALVLVFPTNYLHVDLPMWTNEKKPFWLFEPAPPGKAIEIGFFYAREAKETLEPEFLKIGKPLFYTDLSDGEFVWLVAREADFDPASIPTAAQFNTSPMRLLDPDAVPIGSERSGLNAILWNAPKDGEPLRVIEIGGITATRGE